MDLYRLHTATRSGSNVELYEDRELFEVDLVDALLQAKYNERGLQHWATFRSIAAWLRREDPDRTMRIIRVISVRGLRDGAWHDLKAEVDPPKLHLAWA